MDSDTSSEDEERSAMLREAVGNQVMDTKSQVVNGKPESMKGEVKRNVKPQPPSLPSLRPDKETNLTTDEADIFYTDLSKGAKDFVAKKLSEHLDSELDTTDICFTTKTQTAVQDEGIRLFADSKDLTTSIDVVKVVKQRRRKISSSGDSSSEDERLNEAVVSHDFIVKQSQEVIPSNIKPADIVISNDSVKSVTTNGNSTKKKKKKKKKSKMEDDT